MDATMVQTTGAATGMPRIWLRLEGLAALVAGLAVYLRLGGNPWLFVPLVIAVDATIAGYAAGPRVGGRIYNLAHNWATALAVLGAGLFLGIDALSLAGAILVAHTGMDRLAGYGLKYPTAFADTHLGWIGRRG
ncbi:MAG: DUF4260 domain-containing protein [Chloroflexota bacterium]